MSATTTAIELTFLKGPQAGAVLRVVHDGALLGRLSSADVPVTDPAASREHLRFHRRGADFEAENLSANGTRVNGKPIERRLLRDGDQIQLGAETVIRVRYLVQATTIVSHLQDAAAATSGAVFDEEAAPAAPAPPKPEKRSLLRRPAVLAGLGVYLAGLVAVIVLFETAAPPAGAPPALSREEIVKMLEVYFGPQSRAFERQPDEARMREQLGRGREAYNTAPVSSQSLWRAAYALREAQAYSSAGLLADPADVQRLRTAQQRLADRLADRYVEALAQERQGRLKQARELFNELQAIVSDRASPFNAHLGQRVAYLNLRMEGG